MNLTEADYLVAKLKGELKCGFISNENNEYGDKGTYFHFRGINKNGTRMYSLAEVSRYQIASGRLQELHDEGVLCIRNETYEEWKARMEASE